MTERSFSVCYKGVRDTIGYLNDLPAEWLQMDASDLQDLIDRCRQEMTQCRMLAERAFKMYAGRFGVPPLPAQAEPSMVAQAKSLMHNQEEIDFLLQPTHGGLSGLLARKPKREDYEWFSVAARIAHASYKTDAERLEQWLKFSRETLPARMADYEHAAEMCTVNLSGTDAVWRDAVPGQAPNDTLYLGDIEEPTDLEAAPESFTNSWMDGDWLRRPIAFQANQPFTLFIDAVGPDNSRLASNVLRTLIYQLLRCMHPYTYQLFSLDAVSGGSTLQELQRLKSIVNANAYQLEEQVYANVFRLLVSATTQNEIQKLLEAMDDYVGMANELCGGEGSVTAYNRKWMQNGEPDEDARLLPQRFLFVENVHKSLSTQQIRILDKLIRNAQKCGISMVLTSGRPEGEPLTPEELELRDLCTAKITCEREGCEFQVDTAFLGIETPDGAEPQVLHFPFVFCRNVTPQPEFLEAVKNSFTPKLNNDTIYQNRIDLAGAFGTMDGTQGIVVPIGVDPRGKLTELHIGTSSYPHGLLAGQSGCGKSTLLHAIINGVILHYKPTDVQLWLSDYKANEFRRYATKTPPHIKYVASEKSKEYTLSFLDKIYKEMERRQKLYGSLTDIPGYRQAHGPDSMPRLLIVIDEFHVMSDHVKDDPDYKTKLTNILKEARAYGIAMLLADQTCSVGLNGLSEQGKLQLTLRMSMESSVEEYNAIFDINNAREIPELSTLKPREVTQRLLQERTDAFGLTETVRRFVKSSTLFADQDQRDRITEMAIEKYGPCTDAQFVMPPEPVLPDWEDIRAELSQKNRRGIIFCLGQPNGLAKYTFVRLLPNFNQNIITIGFSETKLLGMLENLLGSLTLLDTPYRAYIIANENSNIFADHEDWLTELAAHDRSCTLVTNEEDTCRLIAELADETERRRTMRRQNRENRFLFWLNMTDLAMSLPHYPRQRPNAPASAPAPAPVQGSDDLHQELDAMFAALFGPDADEPAPAAPAPAAEAPFAPAEEMFLYDATGDIRKLVEDGPGMGIFNMVFHPAVVALKRTRSCAPLDSFQHRIAFPMSKEDSADYLNSGSNILDAEGKIIGKAFAVYSDGQQRQIFIPFQSTVPEDDDE